MKTVYFVRHGEAEVNLESSEAFGGAESPLTARGTEQARLIAQRAARLPAEVLIASSMRRAQETAAAIAAQTGLPVVTSPIFREIEPPHSIVGKSKGDEAAQAAMEAWKVSLYAGAGRVEGSEIFEDIRARAGEALSFLEVRPEQEIVVVTHGHFMRYLLGVVVFGDTFSAAHAQALRWGIRTTNTGIMRVRFDPQDKKRPGWHLSVWNDDAHLG